MKTKVVLPNVILRVLVVGICSLNPNKEPGEESETSTDSFPLIYRTKIDQANCRVDFCRAVLADKVQKSLEAEVRPPT